MKWFTHIGFSILIFLIIKNLFEIIDKKIIVLCLLFSIIGGIFPDIDIHFKIFSKHRGILHSIIGLVLISILLFIIFRILKLNIVFLCFFTSYFFHLFLDAFNPTGIKWLPFLKTSRGKIKTGSFTEKIVAIIIWVLILLFIFI